MAKVRRIEVFPTRRMAKFHMDQQAINKNVTYFNRAYFEYSTPDRVFIVATKPSDIRGMTFDEIYLHPNVKNRQIYFIEAGIRNAQIILRTDDEYER